MEAAIKLNTEEKSKVRTYNYIDLGKVAELVCGKLIPVFQL